MNDELFKALINEVIENGNNSLEYANAYYHLNNDVIKLSWKTGENSGGNCWGGVAQFLQTEQKEPDFSALETLFLNLNENFTLNSYREFKSLVKYDSDYHSDYYGNGSYYDTKEIKIDDIKKIIQNANIILNEYLIIENINYFKKLNNPQAKSNFKK
jgi:hypothetical protein